ncbi:MAG: gliding motility-associated C-terminal domain-containing protein [Prevotellaceae bacterium]|jgi:gliding motility-associated-like protein|nr:gliding motility-associated C-terminal domain-containing protein [Prevotellaceae bacterium]
MSKYFNNIIKQSAKITVKTCAFLLCLFLSDCVYGQSCNFGVALDWVQNSTCQSNGVIKVKLTGANVGDIDMTTVMYSISSSNHLVLPSANGGLFQGLPPGDYIANAKAYCSWAPGNEITVSSSTITITSSYTVPNVHLLDRKPSLECSSTGSMTFEIYDGKEPYSIIIEKRPPEYTGKLVFNNLKAGIFVVDSLAHGIYDIRIKDSCGYSIIKNDMVGLIVHEYKVEKLEDTPTCSNNGKIGVQLKDGTLPYSILMTKYPPTYTGKTQFSVTTNYLEISNLPYGDYDFEVSDACAQSPDIFDNIHIDRMPLYFSDNISIKPANRCEFVGSISFTLPNGVPPYKLEVVSSGHLSGHVQVQASPVFTFNNLPAEQYDFIITDACHVDTVKISATVTTGVLGIDNIAVDNPQSCHAPNGSVQVDIGGGKSPYKIIVKSATAATNIDTTFNVSTKNFSVPDLPPDQYDVMVIDGCADTVKNSFLIDNSYSFTPIKIDTATKAETYGCFASLGSFAIEIIEGEPPYTVVITGGPSSYPKPYPDTVMKDHQGGTHNTIIVNGLHAGTYTVDVFDDCEKLTLTIIIPYVQKNTEEIFPPDDPFGEYLYPPENPDNSCRNVRIQVNRRSFVMNWNISPEQTFEVAFYLSDNPPPSLNSPTLVWQPVTRDANNFMPYTLPKNYKYLRDNNVTLNAIVRPLETTRTYDDTCNIVTTTVSDIIKLHDISSMIYTDDPNCEGFILGIEQYTDYRGVICYPYSVELIDESGKTVKSGISVSSADRYDISGRIPYGKYKIRFKDREGVTWNDSIEYEWWQSNIGITRNADKDLNCTTYTATFTIEACKPYRWTLFDDSGAVLKQVNNVTDSNIETKLLKYGENYKLEIIGAVHDTAVYYPISQSDTILLDYTAQDNASSCQLGTGYIRIYRTGTAQNPNFVQGSKIIYLSGPTVPKHDTITVTGTNVSEVFPFSTNYTTPTYDSIVPGLYKFAVIDTCSKQTDTVDVDFKVYYYDSVSYVLINDCVDGAKVYPSTKLFYGQTDESWRITYRLVSAPAGVSLGSPIPHDGEFHLKVSGKYVIEMIIDSETGPCPKDTFSINFKQLMVRLDLDELKAYICDDGIGHIYIKAIEGSGDYKYVLNDTLRNITMESYDGYFRYGNLGETYIIDVYDLKCGRSFPQSITMIDLKDRFVFVTSKVCVGHQISLDALPISNIYEWTGPNGFTSRAKDTIISNVTFADSGLYTLTVLPKGCTNISQSTHVTVYQPAKPDIEDTIAVCFNTPTAALVATPLAGHVLQWFAADSTALPSAPVPPRNVADTTIYYVKQENNMSCSSEWRKVVFIVEGLPDTVTAISPLICPGQYPVMKISGTDSAYTYNIYNIDGTLAGSMLSPGGDIEITLDNPIDKTTSFLVETVSRRHCASSLKSLATTEVQNLLYISPDKIPPYRRGEYYSAQLESNAVSPYRFYTYDLLPDGFSLSEEGLIAGTASRNGLINPVLFTVELVDGNGCKAQKEYILESVMFVPEAFTPNGDGKNDVFMQGRRLVIFDRLGLKIYEGDNGWDGTRMDGTPAPPDTYFYLIYYEDENLKTTAKKGYITLIRR